MKVLVLSLGELSKLPEIQFGARLPSPFCANRSWLSPAYITQMIDSCLRLFTHWIDCALAFALASAGNNRLAKIAMMAITTSSSISVKPAALPAAAERRPDEEAFHIMMSHFSIKRVYRINSANYSVKPAALQLCVCGHRPPSTSNQHRGRINISSTMALGGRWMASNAHSATSADWSIRARASAVGGFARFSNSGVSMSPGKIAPPRMPLPRASALMDCVRPAGPDLDRT